MSSICRISVILLSSSRNEAALFEEEPQMFKKDPHRSCSPHPHLRRRRGHAAFRLPRRADDQDRGALQADVFAQVNDFHKWDAWSPWAKLDPAAKVGFEGPEAGQGAVMNWAGNDEVGEGKMTIVESRPSDLVKIKVDFIKPFEGTEHVAVRLQARGRPDRRHLDHVGPSQFHREGVLPGDERQEDDR